MSSILVVDDEVMVRELYSAWLEEAGHSVHTAASAMEARDILQREPIDVLVSDIRMARQTGIDLLAWVREHNPDLPVILVTGVPALETAVEALRLQAYDYLVKPVSESVLRRAVDRALEHHYLLREKHRLEADNLRYQQHLEELVAERTAALERRTQQLLLLHKVAHEIGTLQEEDALYRNVVSMTQETFGYTIVSVYVVDWPGGQIRLAAASPPDAEERLQGYTQAIQRGLLGMAARERRAIIANDVEEWPDFVPCPGLNAKAEAIFPIFANDNLVGLLHVSEDEPNAFEETDQIVLQTLAEYLSVAVTNARLYAQVQEALRAREEMLNNVSHELRTPLTIIRGYAELMTEGMLGDVDDEVMHIAQTILEQSKHLTHLVDQLVAFRKVEREGILLEPLHIGDWLHYAVSTWQPVMKEAGLDLELDIENDLGMIQGNVDYLTQVMNNLLDNARKFSPKGSVVRVRAWRNRDQIYVAVSDEGIGVPQDQLGRIFERFYQVDGGTSRRFGGMGLGLALVHEISRRHGGRVWAESEGPGKGLTVIFLLPALDPRPS